MLTDDTLRKVRETARIDEVASGYLTLHRSGKDFVALCPFHDERHPSFRVSPARNIGKCFSCGEAADPIRLVCHMEGCGFEEAVRLLARKYNIEVEETAAAGRERRRDEREALLLANASFASGLLPGHPVGTARTIEDRHGLEETYRGFGVGLCPPDVPQVFRPFLGRLIFPIHTTGGQVAGFAGRSLTPSEKGRKYVNSPDSPAYHKGHILYGLHKAVKAIRSEGRILLCEGYKDVLAFHASGIRYAVGLCGTALTEEHIRAIRRLAGQVTLSLDPDPAGRQNTVRCAHMLLSEGCAVSLLPLPDGMDPDEVYRRKGSDELARLAREGTLDYLSYRIRQAASRPHTDTAAINETLGEIGLLSSPLAVYRRIGELSGATGIPIEVLRQEISVATGPKNVPVPVPKKEAAGLTPALPREAGRAGDALSRSRSGGTAEHGPVRPYAPVRGMRRQPASPARRHGPGRGVPPERERRAGTPSTGGYPRLPLLPHPPSGFPPSHGHRRHQRDVGRDRPPLLPAGRVPKDRGAIRSDGNTDRGTTAGNLRRHRPEKRTGTGAEEGSRRPHARPATRKDVTAFLPHAP